MATMKHELHAQFPFALKDSATQAFAISVLVGKREEHPSWKEVHQLQNTFEGINLLAQSIITPYKEQARIGTRRDPGGYYYWIKHKADAFLKKQVSFINSIGLSPTLPNLSLFPFTSWALKIHFALKKPYISKDDVDFYIIDNPVKKEWIFKVPYVSPSQWKGALRSAMIRKLASKLEDSEINEDEFITERLQLYRLFGDEKDGTAEFLNRIFAEYRLKKKQNNLDTKLEEEIEKVKEEFEAKLIRQGLKTEKVEGYQGWLHFYPTFFDRIGLEVINPHDRKTGAGKQPIYLECVPEETKGTFTLLYVPMSEVDEKVAEEDLKAVTKGVKSMLTKYGFGAKTSSGYGVVDVLKDQSRILPEKWEKVFWKTWEEGDV